MKNAVLTIVLALIAGVAGSALTVALLTGKINIPGSDSSGQAVLADTQANTPSPVATPGESGYRAPSKDSDLEQSAPAALDNSSKKSEPIDAEIDSDSNATAPPATEATAKEESEAPKSAPLQIGRFMSIDALRLPPPPEILNKDTPRAPPPLPDKAREATKRGLLASKSQNWPQAIKHFSEAHEAAPNHPETLFNLALARDQTGGSELVASSWYRAYLAAAPEAKNADQIRNRLIELDVLIKGNMINIASLAVEAANGMPNERRVYSLREVAAALALAGDVSGAKALAETLHLPPNSRLDGKEQKWEALGKIARSQVKTGDFEGAASTALSIYATPLSLRASLKAKVALELIKQGAIGKAKSLIASAESDVDGAKKDDHSRFSSLGDIVEARAKSGDFTGALSSLEKIPAGEIYKDLGRRNIISAMLEEGRLEDAVRQIASIPEKNRNDSLALTTIREFLKKGAVEQAFEVIKLIPATSKHSDGFYREDALEDIGEYYLKKGKAFLKEGNISEAERETRKASDASADSKAQQFVELASQYQKRGKLDDAARCAKSAAEIIKEIPPKEDNNRVTKTLVTVYLKLNNPESALRTLEGMRISEDASSYEKDDPDEVRSEIAKYFLSKNNYDRAESIAINIKDSPIRNETFNKICYDLSKKNRADEAWELALKITDPGRKHNAMIWAYRKSASEKLKPRMFAMLNVAREHESLEKRVSDLCGTLYDLQSDEYHDLRREIFNEALAAAASVENSEKKAQLILDVVGYGMGSGETYGLPIDFRRKGMGAALQAASDISEPKKRSNTFFRAAVIMGKIGEFEQAIASLSKAEIAASECDDPTFQANQLIALGKFYADLGYSKNALRVLAQSESFIQTILEDKDRIIALTGLASAYFEAGSRERCGMVLSVVDEMLGDEPDISNSEITSLWKACLQSQFLDCAERKTPSQDPYGKSYFSSRIEGFVSTLLFPEELDGNGWESQSRSGWLESVGGWEKISAQINRLYIDPYERIQVIMNISKIAQKGGDLDASTGFANVALKTAEQLDPKHKFILRDLVSRFIELEDMDQAVEVASMIDPEKFHDTVVSTYISILNAYVQLGSMERAESLAINLEKNKIDAFQLAKALMAIVHKHQHSGNDASADKVFKKVLQIFEANESDPRFRNSINYSIAFFFAMKGEEKQALSFYNAMRSTQGLPLATSSLEFYNKSAQPEDGLQYLDKIRDEAQRRNATIKVYFNSANFFFASGELEKALNALKKNEKLVNEVPNSAQRFKYLCQLGILVSKAGDPEGANRIINDAEALVPLVAWGTFSARHNYSTRQYSPGRSQGDDPRIRFAEVLIQTGNLAKCLRFLQTINNPRLKSEILWHLCGHLADEKDFARAIKIADLIELPYSSYLAYSRLTQSLRKAGENDLADALEMKLEKEGYPSKIDSMLEQIQLRVADAKNRHKPEEEGTTKQSSKTRLDETKEWARDAEVLSKRIESSYVDNRVVANVPAFLTAVKGEDAEKMDNYLLDAVSELHKARIEQAERVLKWESYWQDFRRGRNEVKPRQAKYPVTAKKTKPSAAPMVAMKKNKLSPPPSTPKENRNTGMGAQIPGLPKRGYFNNAEIFAGGPYANNSDDDHQVILKRVQTALKNEGLYSSGVDGSMGPGTQKALLKWQMAQGIGVTGKLDAATLKSFKLDTGAQAKLGSMEVADYRMYVELYAKGDYIGAYKILREYANQGNYQAMYSIGIMFLQGEGVEKNYYEALSWLRKAADKGHAEAMYVVGGMSASGLGVDKDYVGAFSWFRKAADKGHAEAMRGLGELYFHGNGVNQNYYEALSWFHKAADKGDADSMHNIGVMHSDGLGVDESKAEARSWFRKAADKGEPRAMDRVGDMYSNGLGVNQDNVEALRWYLKAADKGYGPAMTSIGNLYKYSKKGVKQDYAEALRWLRMAADKGEWRAMSDIGLMHGSGMGVKEDQDEALRWFKKAQAQRKANGEDN